MRSKNIFIYFLLVPLIFSTKSVDVEKNGEIHGKIFYPSSRCKLIGLIKNGNPIMIH